jgi:hypothetical protein
VAKHSLRQGQMHGLVMPDRACNHQTIASMRTEAHIEFVPDLLGERFHPPQASHVTLIPKMKMECGFPTSPSSHAATLAARSTSINDATTSLRPEMISRPNDETRPNQTSGRAHCRAVRSSGVIRPRDGNIR